MANATVKGTIESLLPYFPDGAGAVVNGFWHNLPVDVKAADNLALYTYAAISTTKQEIDDDPNSRPLVIIAKSNGTKCYVHFFNADADNVTAGVDVDFVVPVSATSGEVTCLLCLGNGWKTFWDTGLTVTASTATETSAAPTNPPDIFVVYAGS